MSDDLRFADDEPPHETRPDLPSGDGGARERRAPTGPWRIDDWAGTSADCGAFLRLSKAPWGDVGRAAA